MDNVKQFSQHFQSQSGMDYTMPVLFIGHGAPIYALGDNEFSSKWATIGKKLPKAKAIVVISAHWLTRGSWVTAMEKPRTIHDFGRFDDRLFEMHYRAPGNPDLANEIAETLVDQHVQLDHKWGLDHGAWCVLNSMYPDADIPVIQFSIDYRRPSQYHYELAKHLKFLRKKGVLILCSGNIVHNLRMIDFSTDKGFEWAIEFDQKVVDHIDRHDHQGLIDYATLGTSALMSVPTPDHYYPLLYALGLRDTKDELSYPVSGFPFGSTSMRAVLFESH